MYFVPGVRMYMFATWVSYGASHCYLIFSANDCLLIACCLLLAACVFEFGVPQETLLLTCSYCLLLYVL